MQRAFNELALCVKAKIMHRRHEAAARGCGTSSPCTDGTANSNANANANIITFINTSAFVLRNNKHRDKSADDDEDDNVDWQLATVVRRQQQVEQGERQGLSRLTTWQICRLSSVDWRQVAGCCRTCSCRKMANMAG